MPDRLALIKGPPAARRAHLDRLSQRCGRRGREARASFGRALAQRNALLGRVRGGLAPESALDAWDLELAAEAVGADRSPPRGMSSCSPPRSPRPVSRWDCRASPSSATGLAASAPTPTRSPQSFALAARATSTAASPPAARIWTSSTSRSAADRCGATDHRASSAPPCSPCSSPSASCCWSGAASPPLMLLDDVMSELDPERRRVAGLAAGAARADAADGDRPRAASRLRTRRADARRRSCLAVDRCAAEPAPPAMAA